MTTLNDYLKEHAQRCAADLADADVIFFGVKKGPKASLDGLKTAMAGHKGEFADIDPFDGKEHSYIEVGAWIGDQAAALTLIGLGATLGAWKLLTPRTVLGHDCPEDLAQKMAGMGMVALQA
jgi:hypothetical protein